MNVKTIYLETSVLGSLAPRQPADRKRVVKRLLTLLDGIRGVCVVSDVVLEEIELAPAIVAEPIRRALAEVQPLIHRLPVRFVPWPAPIWRRAFCPNAGYRTLF